jgi:hypothetical protein
MANDFFSFDIPVSREERGAGSGAFSGVRSLENGATYPWRGRLSLKGLSGETYREFAPVQDGGFIIAKPLGEDAVLCAVIDPAGRGPDSVRIGAHLKESADGLLGPDFLRYAERKPDAALERLDETLDQAMSDLNMPGSFTMLSALIMNAKTGHASLLCRGMDGAAAVRAGGNPAWAAGCGLPPYGIMPREILLMSARPTVKHYNFAPSDMLVLANAHFAELPSTHDTSEKVLLPVMAARAAKGGRLKADSLAITLPPPDAQGLSHPERMALAAHALRLADLAADPSIERSDLTLEVTQADYFEAICRASALRLPQPKRIDGGRVLYADASPLAVKGLLAISLRREVA